MTGDEDDGAVFPEAEKYINDPFGVLSSCNYEEGTYERFVQKVFASYEHPANQKRLGQVFFNKLHKERPDVAEKIQGTLFDPFYQEYIHQKVYDQVRRLWYGEEDE